MAGCRKLELGVDPDNRDAGIGVGRNDFQCVGSGVRTLCCCGITDVYQRLCNDLARAGFGIGSMGNRQVQSMAGVVLLRLAWCQPSRSNIGFSLDDLAFVEKLAENRFGFIALQTLAEEFQLLMHLVLYPALVWPHKLSGELQRLRWLGSQGFGLFQRIR